MKILFTVEFYEPQKGGAEEVVRQLSERLVQKGHQVTVATTFAKERTIGLMNGVRVEQFKIHGNAVKGIRGSSHERERYERLLESDFDLIVNYAAQNWPTDIALTMLDRISARKVIVPCGYSGLNNPAYANYFLRLPELLDKYDALIYMSLNYQDKIFGDQHGLAAKALLIPNGASAEEFQAPSLIDIRAKYGLGNRKIIVTVANHYFAKGHAFVIEAFQRMRTDNIVLCVVGELPHYHRWYTCYPFCRVKSLMHRRVKLLTGLAREEVVAAYRAADLFLFGSRIECAPLVMYEAFAARVPFITRLVGNVSDHTDALTIVHTPQEMAVAADTLLNRPKHWQRKAERAFKLWEDKHRWDQIVDQYERLFTNILTQRK